jgi:hypothetical protein
MVRVKYSLLVKVFAFAFFAFFILPAFLRLIGGPSSPKDHHEPHAPHGNNDYVDDTGGKNNNNGRKFGAPSRVGTVKHLLNLLT